MSSSTFKVTYNLGLTTKTATFTVSSNNATFTDGATITLSYSGPSDYIQTQLSLPGLDVKVYINSSSGYKLLGSSYLYPDSGKTSYSKTYSIPLSAASNWTTSNSVSYKVEYYAASYLNSFKEGDLITTTTGTLTFANCTQLSPTCSISLSDVGTKPSGWTWTQTLSKVKASATNVATKYGATIKSYTVSVGSYSKTGTSNGVTTDAINLTGAQKCVVTVTDSRGLTGTASEYINFKSYAPPTATSLATVRCDSNGTVNDEGTSAKFKLPTFKVDTTQTNSLQSAKVYYKLKTATSWTNTGKDIKDDKTMIFVSGLDKNETYDVRLDLTDLVKTVSFYSSIDGAYFTMDFLKGGHGIAFGIASTKEGFECNMPTTFDSTIQGNSSLTVNGAITGKSTLKISGASTLTGDVTGEGNISAKSALSAGLNVWAQNGNVYARSTAFTDTSTATNGATQNRYFMFKDNSNNDLGGLRFIANTDGSIQLQLLAVKAVGTSRSWKGILTGKVDHAGNVTYSWANGAGVRNSLGLGNTTGALPVANGGTGATELHAARYNLGIRINTLWTGSVTTGGSISVGNDADKYELFGCTVSLSASDTIQAPLLIALARSRGLSGNVAFAGSWDDASHSYEYRASFSRDSGTWKLVQASRHMMTTSNMDGKVLYVRGIYGIA